VIGQSIADARPARHDTYSRLVKKMVSLTDHFDGNNRTKYTS